MKSKLYLIISILFALVSCGNRNDIEDIYDVSYFFDNQTTDTVYYKFAADASSSQPSIVAIPPYHNKYIHGAVVEKSALESTKLLFDYIWIRYQNKVYEFDSNDVNSPLNTADFVEDASLNSNALPHLQQLSLKFQFTDEWFGTLE